MENGAYSLRLELGDAHRIGDLARGAFSRHIQIHEEAFPALVWEMNT
jgi:hypothetical protein